MKIFALWLCLNVGFIPDGSIGISNEGIYDSTCMEFDTGLTMEAKLFNDRVFFGSSVDLYLYLEREDVLLRPNTLHAQFYTGVRLWKDHVVIRYDYDLYMHPIVPSDYRRGRILKGDSNKVSILLQSEIPFRD